MTQKMLCCARAAHLCSSDYFMYQHSGCHYKLHCLWSLAQYVAMEEHGEFEAFLCLTVTMCMTTHRLAQMLRGGVCKVSKGMMKRLLSVYDC